MAQSLNSENVPVTTSHGDDTKVVNVNLGEVASSAAEAVLAAAAPETAAEEKKEETQEAAKQ